MPTSEPPQDQDAPRDRVREAELSALMRRSQNGDRQAYAVLLEACREWLVRFYGRKVAAGGVDDLVQETLISLHRKRATYDPEKPFLPWLAAIARYRWIDQLRIAYRHARVELKTDVAVGSDEEAVIARLSLERLMDRISPAQAMAISLVKVEGLSTAEAAARSGQSESLVKVNVHRGLRRLAALVESE